MAVEKTLWVQSGLPAGKTAFWEVDAAHPGGEVFVAAREGAGGEVLNPPVEVGETSQVNGALRDERLVRTDAPGKTPEPARPDAKLEPAK